MIWSSIEQYGDGELSPPEAEVIRRHLECCSRCREEYEATLRLKKLLKQKPVPDPGADYWLETAALIRARTVDSPIEKGTSLFPVTEVFPRRDALVRSLVSIAASLTLLATALLIGTSQQGRVSALNTSEAPVLATAAVSELLDAHGLPLVTRAEQMRLAKGTFLMGSPSFLGRFEGLPDLIEEIE
jgi:anti-sigma factor RsiW